MFDYIKLNKWYNIISFSNDTIIFKYDGVYTYEVFKNKVRRLVISPSKYYRYNDINRIEECTEIECMLYDLA